MSILFVLKLESIFSISIVYGRLISIESFVSLELSVASRSRIKLSKSASRSFLTSSASTACTCGAIFFSSAPYKTEFVINKDKDDKPCVESPPLSPSGSAVGVP